MGGIGGVEYGGGIRNREVGVLYYIYCVFGVTLGSVSQTAGCTVMYDEKC